MLDKKQQQSLLALVRRTIAATLALEIDSYQVEEDPLFKEKRGAFVTLHKHGNLRGCIGYIEAIKPLFETIQEMASAAAFEDPRFPKLAADEFDQIDIEISVLSPIFPIKDVNTIEVGRYGLIISQGLHRGLLLPQVATEQEWDTHTFLQHTCMKAGLPADAWQHGARLEGFTAFVFGEKK